MKEQGKCGENTELHEKLTSNDKHIKHDSVKRDIRDMTPGEEVHCLSIVQLNRHFLCADSFSFSVVSSGRRCS